MKITVITSPFGELPPAAIGAVEKHFYLMAGEWVKMGHCVTFICAGGGGVNCIRLKKHKRTGSIVGDLFWDFLYSFKALWRCRKTDVLLCNTFWTPALAPLFRWKYGKLVYCVERYPKGQFWLYPFVHAHVCVSVVVADALRKELKGWSRADIVVINNTIDGEVFQRHPARPRTTELVVVYAGRIHPEKGLDILFEAAEQLALQNAARPVKLKMIGTWDIGRGGGGEAYVKCLERLAPHAMVEWVGAIADPKVLATAICEGDCFAYPSVAAKGETFGVAPLEAMALGLPTILSDLACFSDYAEAGVNSIRISLGVNAVAEMREALARVRDDSDAMARMSENAAATAKRFTKERIAARYVDFFSRLICEGTECCRVALKLNK